MELLNTDERITELLEDVINLVEIDSKSKDFGTLTILHSDNEENKSTELGDPTVKTLESMNTEENSVHELTRNDVNLNIDDTEALKEDPDISKPCSKQALLLEDSDIYDSEMDNSEEISLKNCTDSEDFSKNTRGTVSGEGKQLTDSDISQNLLNSEICDENINTSEEKNCEDDFDKPEDDSQFEEKTDNNNKTKKHKTLKSQKAMKDELTTIYSENQRKLRETSINLPYHKPRMPSLSEFLNRRKSVNKENYNLRPNLLKVENPDIVCSHYETAKPEEKVNTEVDDDDELNDFELPSLTETEEEKTKTPAESDETNETKENNPASVIDCANKTESLRKRKLSILNTPQLKNIVPQLSGTPELMIDLSFSPEKSSGVEELLGRFVKHTSKSVPLGEQQVKLHLVSKELSEEGKEDLKSNEIIVKVKPLGEEEKPGLNIKKFSTVKAKLLEDISKKKQKDLEIKVNNYQLENEEGFEEEEEEEELTEDEEDIIDDGAYEDDDNDEVQNEFLDSAAVEDNDSEDGDSESETEIEIKDKKPLEDLHETGDNKSIINDQDDNKAQEEQDIPSQDIFHTEKSKPNLESSFEFMPSVITPNQPNKRRHENSESDNESCLSLTPRKAGPSWLSQSRNFPKSSSFDTSMEDSLKLHLEADSYLSQETFKEPVGFSQLRDGSEVNSSENMNELLGLCTGDFATNKSSQMEGNQTGQTQNMNELLELCSGKFDEPDEGDESSGDEEIVKTTQVKKVPKLCFDSDSEAEDQPDVEKKDCDSGSDDTDSSDEKDIEEFDDEEELIDSKEKHKRPVLADFFEEEAELSGSDIGSEDEDEEDDEENDIFGDEVPDNEKVSDEELRNQVGRAHLKAILDEDKRELRFFQNMYLEDGDLHSEGGGRTRQFRWKNAGNHSLIDDSENQSEEEEAEKEENQNESWRMQRFEREKWLQEQKTENQSPGKVSKVKNFRLVNRTSFGDATAVRKSELRSKEAGQDPSKSFLSRNTNFLRSLSEKINRQEAEEGVGKRSTKNFVFLSASPEKFAVKRPAEEKLVNKNKRPKIVSVPSRPPKNKSVFDFIE